MLHGRKTLPSFIVYRIRAAERSASALRNQAHPAKGLPACFAEAVCSTATTHNVPPTTSAIVLAIFTLAMSGYAQLKERKREDYPYLLDYRTRW